MKLSVPQANMIILWPYKNTGQHSGLAKSEMLLAFVNSYEEIRTMIHTLAAALKSASVDFETLHHRYNPMLALVRELIGIVPSFDPILEIWPPGFRTCNLPVPNLFNLPHTLFGHDCKVLLRRL